MYTYADWSRDRYFRAKPGEEIDYRCWITEMYMDDTEPRPLPAEFIGFDEGFQTRMPVRWEDGLPYFLTFGARDGRYYYLGEFSCPRTRRTVDVADPTAGKP